MNVRAVTNANRSAWNKVAPVQKKLLGQKLFSRFSEKGYSVLDEVVAVKMLKIGLSGKYVAQLCCNIGHETISLANLGAAAAVGFDISDEAIGFAEELNRVAGQDCRFVRTDVYDIDSKYNNCFDLLYISAGALAWMPDLDRFFSVASRILRNNGLLVVYEVHPMLYMFAAKEEEDYDPVNPDKIMYSYFEKDVWIDNREDFAIGDIKYGNSINYSYTHNLSYILNTIINNCFIITEFNEYPHDISGTYRFLEDSYKLPMCFMLLARKMNFGI